MKRVRRKAALLLALLLALGCGAEALAESGWREGLSPQKPYAGVPEVDLSQQIGYMIFSPTKQRSVETSCQRLFIYLPRTDVKAGEGQLYLCTEEDGVLWQTPMNDEAAITQRDMTKAELTSLMWGEGTCFEIKLARSLELGRTYFVNMERGCIETKDGSISNSELGGTQGWRFTLTGDYGVSGMEYRRVIGEAATEEAGEPEATPEPAATQDPGVTLEPGATPTPDPELERLINLANGVTPEPTQGPELEYESGILQPKAGDEIRFDLTLGGDATIAVIYGYNDTVDFPEVAFYQSGEVRGEVLAPSPAWGVMFLDDAGNELNRVEFR